MPRSDEDERRRARRYGRRHAVLRAQESAKDLDAMAKRLLAELARAGAPRDEVRTLAKALDAVTDVTRRRRALWAIVAALEARDAFTPP